MRILGKGKNKKWVLIRENWNGFVGKEGVHENQEMREQNGIIDVWLLWEEHYTQC